MGLTHKTHWVGLKKVGF